MPRARLERPYLTPFSVPREDTTTSTTVLSTLAGALSVGEVILGFFTMEEANALRLVCSEMREAVAGAAWFDMKTRIAGSLATWRARFPKARAANVEKRRDLADGDFVHLKGVHMLDMSHRNHPGITDLAFVNRIKGIHMLCDQEGITDAALTLTEQQRPARNCPQRGPAGCPAARLPDTDPARKYD